MSYARLSHPGCDVYIFGSGTALECHISYEINHLLFSRDFYAEYDDARPGRAEREMLGYLRMLQYEGIRVPEDAISRLCMEIRDIEIEKFEDTEVAENDSSQVN